MRIFDSFWRYLGVNTGNKEGTKQSCGTKHYSDTDSVEYCASIGAASPDWRFSYKFPCRKKVRSLEN